MVAKSIQVHRVFNSGGIRISYNDPAIGIEWPLQDVQVSNKDAGSTIPEAVAGFALSDNIVYQPISVP